MKKNKYIILILLLIFTLLYLLLFKNKNININNELFGGIFYINLEHRKDRKKQIESELNKMNLKYERYNAIKNEKGYLGCTLSHLNILKEAKRRNLKNVLIFEDDFKFIIDKSKFWEKMNNFFNNNIDYDVLLIGYNIKKSEIYNDKLLKILDSQTTSSYLVNSKFYDKLIKNFEEGYISLKETDIKEQYACDQYWKKLQPMNNWYAFKERIGIQRESYSDIERINVKYDTFINYIHL